MNDATLNGKFMASGGAGNDVSAALADESNSVNWINGHEAHVLWGTNGQKTTDHFEVKLQPGIYYLSISNAFSIVSDKDIDLNLNLTFKR